MLNFLTNKSKVRITTEEDEEEAWILYVTAPLTNSPHIYFIDRIVAFKRYYNTKIFSQSYFENV